MSATDERLWLTDNPPSDRWPLYTRGNVGEVFPEVVLPLTWDLFGLEAEGGWREAYAEMGLVVEGDFDEADPMTILGVFGGYCYINASYVRLVGVRAPGGSVELIDQQFLGESDAPPYKPRPGDQNRGATARLGRTALGLLAIKELPELEMDKRRANAWIHQYPGVDAEDDLLLDYLQASRTIFRHLFRRHIYNSMAVAMVSGPLIDLMTKIDRQDRLVAVLSGIGDVDSAAPSAAMWALAHSPHAEGSEEWQAQFEDFLLEFGSRGPNEWDLGSDPWEFRPELALAAIERMRHADLGNEPSAQRVRLARQRGVEIAEAKGRFSARDRVLFDRSLQATAVLSQARERSKTTIIKVVHSTRRAQRELACRAAERGGPIDPTLSCMLSLEELRSFVSDPAPWSDILDERAARHAHLSSLTPPFIVDGTVPSVETWKLRKATLEARSSGDQIHGIAGCPGTATGRAVVVLEPGEPRELGPGDVLVAPITDPSWTPLFLASDAVVVDVGATMSHAVIVSRELGIPCVVSATDATKTIPDGATIEVDGNSGVVTILDVP